MVQGFFRFCGGIFEEGFELRMMEESLKAGVERQSLLLWGA